MQLNGNNGIFTFALFLIASTAPGQVPTYDLLRGHHEFHMDYDVESGWWAGASYNLNDDFNDFDQVRRVEASDLEFVCPPVSRKISSAATSWLAPVGQPLWVLPQNQVAGNHYFGMRVLVGAGVFMTRVGNNYLAFGQGTIGLRLVSVSGSGIERGGHFALWETDAFGTPVIYFNSADGITSGDDIPSLPAGAHSHFNWGLTRPGRYDVTLRSYGRLRTGQDTSRDTTITFQVPHDGTPTSLDARFLHAGNSWEMACLDRVASVAYAADHCYPMATTTSGLGWQMPFTFSNSPVTTMDRVGFDDTLAVSPADFPGGTRLNLIGHIGPGDFVAKDSSEQTVLDTRDGIDSADTVILGGSDRTGQFHFTEAGIHRLTFTLTGLAANGSDLITSPPLTLRCGANLAAGHGYAQWADSFERAHGLAAGSLADPSGNPDHDGLPNQLEYLLDAGGADPLIADQFGQAVPSSDGPVAFQFWRDLTKDQLTDASPSLRPSYSRDLVEWETLRNLIPGIPIALHEAPAAPGNARSPFMPRLLRQADHPGEKGFFRLQGN